MRHIEDSKLEVQEEHEKKRHSIDTVSDKDFNRFLNCFFRV